MKTLILWTLLVGGLLSLTACHWQNRDRHRYQDGDHNRGGYYDRH